MPTSQRRSRMRRRRPDWLGLETADRYLLDQNGRAAAETTGEYEAQVVGHRHHVAQQGDHVAGDGQLLHRLREPAVFDPVSGQSEREFTGDRVDGVEAGELRDV